MKNWSYRINPQISKMLKKILKPSLQAWLSLQPMLKLHWAFSNMSYSFSNSWLYADCSRTTDRTCRAFVQIRKRLLPPAGGTSGPRRIACWEELGWISAFPSIICTIILWILSCSCNNCDLSLSSFFIKQIKCHLQLLPGTVSLLHFWLCTILFIQLVFVSLCSKRL